MHEIASVAISYFIFQSTKIALQLLIHPQDFNPIEIMSLRLYCGVNKSAEKNGPFSIPWFIKMKST